MKVLGILLALAGGVCAEPITFEFEGVLNWTSFSVDVLDLEVGAVVRGSYTFDSDTPDYSPQHTWVGSYSADSSGLGWNGVPSLPGEFTATIGSYTLTTLRYGISVRDDWKTDGHDAYVLGNTGTGPGVSTFAREGMVLEERDISWGFGTAEDHTGSTLQSDALPLAPPPFEVWTFAVGLRLNGQSRSFQAEITSVTVANPIPEPGTYALFGVALLGYGVYRRRRKAS